MGVDERRAVGGEEPHRVGAPEAEAALDGGDVDNMEGARGEHRSCGEDPSVVVGVVAEHVAREVNLLPAGVVELDPVVRRTRLGLDLVDDDASGGRLGIQGREPEDRDGYSCGEHDAGLAHGCLLVGGVLAQPTSGG